MGRLYALVSAGGSPGVSTAAIALALTWPALVIVAECDPSGGDILAGALAGHVAASTGLMEFAIEAGRSPRTATASLADRLVSLDEEQTTMVLPGLTDPRQAISMMPAWPAVARVLSSQPADVIADCGRLDSGDHQPMAVLAAAHVVAIVLRPTLRQAWAARARVEVLGRQATATDRLGLILTGPGEVPARELARTLGLPVMAVLPDDPRTAAVLSDGVGQRAKLATAPLIRSADSAGQALRRWLISDAQRLAGVGR